jgi:uncharacterized protein (TIGR04255 family)
MPIPDSQRVEYANNTLVEVVCQLRFPTILRIESEKPTAFQERIRREYPLYAEKTTDSFPTPLPSGIPIEIGRLLHTPQSYEFADADQAWRISLTNEFVALTGTRYSRWEQFRERLTTILDALCAVYEPAHYSRVGLRYRNVITRSNLGLDPASPWSDLLNEWAIGELSRSEVSAEIQQSFREVVLRLGEFESLVRIQHGLAGTEPPTADELSYIIDCDFFTPRKTEITDAHAVLNFLNQQSGRLFRWYIREPLHAAMEPNSID